MDATTTETTTAAELSRIYEATLASGPSGAVLKGAEIDRPAALVRRRAGQDVVVCGQDLAANRKIALELESAIGPCVRQEPHDAQAGSAALPHFQQKSRPPAGHCFYETPRRKARKSR